MTVTKKDDVIFSSFNRRIVSVNQALEDCREAGRLISHAPKLMFEIWPDETIRHILTGPRSEEAPGQEGPARA